MGGLCCKEVLDPHQARGYVVATDHTACYHDNKQKFPFIDFIRALFNTDSALPSPLSTPPPPSLPPVRVWGGAPQSMAWGGERSETGHMTDADVGAMVASVLSLEALVSLALQQNPPTPTPTPRCL